MDSMSHGRAPVGDGDKQPAGGGVQRPLGAGDSLQAARRGRRPEGVLAPRGGGVLQGPRCRGWRRPGREMLREESSRGEHGREEEE